MPSERPPPRVVIVGGGFCGAALALHLLRLAERPVEISVVEPAPQLGRGIAYAQGDPIHRINIPSARMAVFQDAPDHFHRHAASIGAIEADPAGLQANGDFYARRALFGDYVAGLLAAAAAARPEAQLIHVEARALAWDGGSVRLEDGRRIEADALAIATGNPRPSLPQALAAIADDARLIRDPWGDAPLRGIGREARVLILGTGLTMADAAAALLARGHRGPITAISRHGLRQRRKRPGPYHPDTDFSTLPGESASALLRSVRVAIRRAEVAGDGWEDVIEALRLQGRTIWRRLARAEQKRVLRHLRPWWDVHRYQVAPPIDDILGAAIAEGRLAILAGRVLAGAADAAGLTIAWRRRGGEAVETNLFDHVIDVTGPAVSRLLATNPFLADLAGRGMIRPDPLGLGLDTDSGGVAIGTATVPVHVVGSLARAAYGELAGIRELSAQAGDVALALASRFGLADRLPPRGDLLSPHPSPPAAVQALPEPSC